MGNDYRQRSGLTMNEGFKKIELPKVFGKLKMKSVKKNRKPFFRYIGLVGGILLVLLIIVGINIFIPGKDIFSSGQETAIVAREVYQAAKNQDIETARSKIKHLQTKLKKLETNVYRLNWAGILPMIGRYQKDMQHLVRATISAVEAADLAIETLIPYSDLLGLKGKATFVSGSADDRIKTAVETLDKIIPNLDSIAVKINSSEKELNQINFDRYPNNIGNMSVKSRLVNIKFIFSEAASLFVEAQPLLKKIPALLGNKDPKRYLILFQNDAELRATGGFITAYAVFKIDKGKMMVENADDIYKLDQAKRKKFPAPESILKYHKNVNNLELRDSNLSPDFYISMTEFKRLLQESIPDFPKFDGIIAIDTHVLVSAIKILGEFNVYGKNFTAENDSRCDCPKAIYELEDYSTRPVAYLRDERKDIIGVLMYQIMQRSLGVSPSQYWGRLSQMFLEEARQKHILFYFSDSDAQKGIEAINFGGRIREAEGDYLHINNVNFAGAKSNLFVKHTTKQEISTASDGTITKSITISYKNPSKASNCNLEAGQLCLNGILRNWLRIYVPKGSTLVEFIGSEKDTRTYEELGKTVFEGFLTVKPEGFTEIKLKYLLPFRQSKSSPYKLTIQKQPGTDDHQYIISVNGKEMEKHVLLEDSEFPKYGN